jgi:hypothetical protein
LQNVIVQVDLAFQKFDESGDDKLNYRYELMCGMEEPEEQGNVVFA